MPEEPSVNIGAAAGEPIDRSAPDSGASRAERVVHRLGSLYWRRSYGNRDAFGCLVRTILSQNTSDVASQPAFDALVERFGDDGLLPGLRTADRSAIIACIRPAGLYNRKATVLRSAAERVTADYGDATSFQDFVRDAPGPEVRETLLDLDGVGPKTADCVLLFAGGRPGTFPVDTHVHRIYRRLGIAPPEADHETVRTILEREVPPDRCGFGHTASIQFGREYCTAEAPACLDGECPLADCCDRVGVDPEANAVVDPAETR